MKVKWAGRRLKREREPGARQRDILHIIAIKK